MRVEHRRQGMALPPASFVLLWLTIAVGFVFFGALAVGALALFGYLGYQVVGGTDEPTDADEA